LTGATDRDRENRQSKQQQDIPPGACARLSGIPPRRRVNAKRPTGNIAPNLARHVLLGPLGLRARDRNPMLSHTLMRPTFGLHLDDVPRLAPHAAVSVQMSMGRLM
jgi:hypothetical protein